MRSGRIHTEPAWIGHQTLAFKPGVKTRIPAIVALCLLLAATPAPGQDGPPPGVLATTVLTSVEFRGRKGVELAELEAITRLKKGATVDAFRIAESVLEVDKLYRHKGFEKVEVRLIEGTQTGATRVVIEITEGPKSAEMPVAVAPGLSTVSTDSHDDKPPSIVNFFHKDALPVGDSFGKESTKKEPASHLYLEAVDTNAPWPSLTGELIAPILEPFPSLDPVEAAPVPTESERHLELAAEARKSGKLKEALREASIAVRLAPDVADTYRKRAEIYTSLNLYRQAIADLARASELDPNDPNVFLERSEAFCQDRDFEQCQAELAKAMDRCDTDQSRAVVFHWRGRARLAEGAISEAIADFDQAIELGMTHPDLLVGRGLGFARLGRHDRAIADYDHAIELQSSDTGYFLRAESLQALGKYALAQADLDRAVGDSPKHPSYLRARGLLRLKLGQLDPAIDDFNKFLDEKQPGDAWRVTAGCPTPLWVYTERTRALTGRGWAYLLKHDLKRAKADFDLAVSLQRPGIALMGLVFGSTIDTDPQYDRAIAEFNELSLQAPRIPFALILLQRKEGRSQFLEDPYVAAYLVWRRGAFFGISPPIIGGLTADWRSFPEAYSAALGQALVAILQRDWKEAREKLEETGISLACGFFPALMRQPGSTYFR